MNTRARRLSSTFRFVFGPLRRAGNVLSWWSTALAVVAAAAAVVGLSLPRHVGGLWIAIGGLAGLVIVVFAGAYRLHRLAFPDFPKHRLDLGRPWVIEHELEKLLLLEVTFYNREPQRRVNLTLDVLWSRVVGEQSLGPYRLHPFLGPAGSIVLLPRSADVGPEKHTEGTAIFRTETVPGLTLGDEGSDFEAPDIWSSKFA